MSEKVDYENYRFNNSIDASTKAEEMGSFGSHVGKSKDGEVYFYPCETFSELKSALFKSSNLSTKKLSLLIEKGTLILPIMQKNLNLKEANQQLPFMKLYLTI